MDLLSRYVSSELEESHQIERCIKSLRMELEGLEVVVE